MTTAETATAATTHPSGSEIERLALHAIYRKIERALEAIEAGDMKKATVELRHVLPRTYRRSFEWRGDDSPFGL